MSGWRKSSHSANNGACVEAGQGDGVIGIRDSADAESPVLVFPAAAWAAFTSSLRSP